MAGAGAKKFAANSLLSSDDVNNYLADQVIMRFATSVARDAAFGGAGEPTLAEGMFCYLDDTNEIQSYNGSAWVGVAASSTVRDVSSGLVFISTTTFTTGTSVSLPTGTFTTAYTNYLLKVEITVTAATGSTALYLRFRTSGTDKSTPSSYRTIMRQDRYAGDTALVAADGSAQAFIGYGYSGVADFAGELTVTAPMLARYTHAHYLGAGLGNAGGGAMNNTQIVWPSTDLFDSLSIYNSDSKNMTGSISVYGYRI